MKRIRFTADAEYKCIPGPVFYRAGSVHELRDDLAARWIRRGVAVELPPAPFVDRSAEFDRALKAAESGDGEAIATLPVLAEAMFQDSEPLTESELDAAEAELTAVVAAMPQAQPENKPRRGRPPKRLA